MSSRAIDQNGYMTIDANPITRAGVFEYLGKQIGAPVPDKIYKVFRPPEELACPQAQASFKNLPIIDDHVMLGMKDKGYTSPEEKGVQGTTGAAIDFRENVLYSDIRIFSDALQKKIASGKKGLSLGYRCSYTPEAGIFDGQVYDYVQRSLRGNHLALVDAPRNDVFVLDNKIITFDSLDLSTTQEENDMTITLDALDEKINKLADAVTKRFEAQDEAEKKAAEDKAAADKKAMDDLEDLKKKEAEKEAADKAAKDDDKKDAAAMDAALKKIDDLTKQVETLSKGGIKAVVDEVSKRDALARSVAPYIGTFDCADKTLAEVQTYALDKLGLKAEAGQEGAAIAGFLHNRSAAQPGFAMAMDSAAGASDELNAYLTKKTA